MTPLRNTLASCVAEQGSRPPSTQSDLVKASLLRSCQDAMVESQTRVPHPSQTGPPLAVLLPQNAALLIPEMQDSPHRGQLHQPQEWIGLP